MLIPGALAPKLLTREMVARDEGRARSSATSRSIRAAAPRPRAPTTHDDPVYVVDGVIHYCVANMPGAVPITSTKALTNVTLPYVEAIADHGLAAAVARDPALARGVNVLDGRITYEAVAEAHGLEYTPLDDALRVRRSEPPAVAAARGVLAGFQLLLALRRAELDDEPRDGAARPMIADDVDGEADQTEDCSMRAVE